MSTRVEYAVQYTGVKRGKIRTVVEELADPTDYQAAKRLREDTLDWQENADKRLRLSPDAEIVTRTVRVSSWETEDAQRSRRESAELAEAARFQDALNAMATFVVIYEPGRPEDSRTADSLLRYVLVDSRRPAAVKMTPIPDELWQWASDERKALVEQARVRVAARG